MLRFKKLKIAGFKSFVEPTDLFIERGLTGVVGPNGCGKSNLIESLRWVMGETSAKQMRGGAMDDVIFGGSADRPARNIAEVMLSLDNSARVAPAQFNDVDELDISRRIERDKGSTYRINGKEVRARDVQLLFADSATGARSTAIVSQGKIGAIIAAKPTDRRAILEEAAGITGLHSRRHEAELRLRGAETNLERLDDIMATLEAQQQNLKKQSRQATRYRNISGHIRKAEATLYFLRWSFAAEQLELAREQFQQAEAQVIEQSKRVSAATVKHEQCAAVTPELRKTEAEAAAELQRTVLARETLDAEERRIEAAREECRLRLEQTAADGAREQALSADAGQAVKNLEDERVKIEDAQQGEQVAGKEAAENLAAANDSVNAMEAQLTAITERAAADDARRTSLENTVREVQERKNRLGDRAQGIARQRAELDTQAEDVAALEAADATLNQAREKLEDCRTALVKSETARNEIAAAAAEAVTKQQAAEAVMTRLEAEQQALAQVLKAGDTDERWPPVLDSLTVEPGYEAALGAALGEDLSAPVDEPAPAFWRTLSPFSTPPSLPDGTQALSDFVKGPAALIRRLSQIGVVGGEQDGNRIAASLCQGQRLISRDGGLWRWDGLTVRAGTPTASAMRLAQLNRLVDVRAKLEAAQQDVAHAAAANNKARSLMDEAVEAERQARENLRAADASFTQARESQAGLKEKMTGLSSRLSALAEAGEAIKADQTEADAQASEAAAALAALPDANIARDEIANLRSQLAELRTGQLECQSAHDNLARAASDRRRRLGDIASEHDSWFQRGQGAVERMAHLAERSEKAKQELDRLSLRPAEIAEQRNALLSKVEAAESNRKKAADKLAEAENNQNEAQQNLRAAELELAGVREQRVRAEGAVEQGKQAVESLTERIAEKLDCGPGELIEITGLKQDAELPELEAVERRVDRLQLERETMGPVNLRAEQEINELNEQFETLTTERDDLTKAIEKLRQGISELNREGRQRLLASFKEVDQHFQELFVRLFGGGRAHLALTESDDPLDAGLEIMASPPGKRLQVLSLLSGGEQALTALALLFGVFLTNPAPICVLDEVDAPLDDSNVDRFCSMLSEMAETGRTRFLVVTHHHMTMARMDRLFGVTMAERGVSQLVSVDLAQAEEMRAAG